MTFFSTFLAKNQFLAIFTPKKRKPKKHFLLMNTLLGAVILFFRTFLSLESFGQISKSQNIRKYFFGKWKFFSTFWAKNQFLAIFAEKKIKPKKYFLLINTLLGQSFYFFTTFLSLEPFGRAQQKLKLFSICKKNCLPLLPKMAENGPFVKKKISQRGLRASSKRQNFPCFFRKTDAHIYLLDL